jgi:capsular polysaccharide biosynthesis protein
LVKRGHRAGALAIGALSRPTTARLRDGVRTGRRTSRETVAADPSTATIHALGAAQVLDRPLAAGDPAGLTFLSERRQAVIPERFVLELAGGRLISRHGAVVTADGILDHETSHYFGIESWREHPVFWNPWPSRPEVVDGTVAVLAARGTGHNFYHFVTDELPRIGLLREAFGDLSPDAWVLDRHTGYQKQLLAMLGMEPERVVTPAAGLHLQAKRLLVPSLPNATMDAPPESQRWLRDNLPPLTTTGLPEKIYVTRGTTPNTRRMVREDDVRGLLERRGFVCVDPGSLSVQEQIDHFAAARVIVAPHGAALTNLAFCRDGVRVLELFAPGYTVHCYWAMTANIVDSHYRYLVARTPTGTGDNELMQDIELGADEVGDALDALLAD